MMRNDSSRTVLEMMKDRDGIPPSYGELHRPALYLFLLSLCSCVLLPPLGPIFVIWMAKNAIRVIDRSPHLRGRGLAVAAIVIAGVELLLGLLTMGLFSSV